MPSPYCSTSSLSRFATNARHDAIFRVLSDSSRPLSVTEVFMRVYRLGTRRLVDAAMQSMVKAGRIEVATKSKWAETTYRVAKPSTEKT